MTDVGKVIDDLRRESPEFNAATAEIELVRKVGDMLQKMREDVGLTQRELADRLGMTASRVSQLESGTLRDAPSLKMLARYASACSQTIELGFANAPASVEDKGLLTMIAQGVAKISQQLSQAAVKPPVIGPRFAGFAALQGVSLNDVAINAITTQIARATYVTLIDAGVKVGSADDIHVDVKGVGSGDDATEMQPGQDLQMTVTVPFGS